MSEIQIPAEHQAKLAAASNDQLVAVLQHNLAEARREYACGSRVAAQKLYAYVDACQAIIDSRRGKVVAAPAPRRTASASATPSQVAYITKLLARRSSEAGFSGLVSGLKADGRIDADAIRRLTKRQASEVIDSLTENY